MVDARHRSELPASAPYLVPPHLKCPWPNYQPLATAHRALQAPGWSTMRVVLVSWQTSKDGARTASLSRRSRLCRAWATGVPSQRIARPVTGPAYSHSYRVSSSLRRSKSWGSVLIPLLSGSLWFSSTTATLVVHADFGLSRKRCVARVGFVSSAGGKCLLKCLCWVRARLTRNQTFGRRFLLRVPISQAMKSSNVGCTWLAGNSRAVHPESRSTPTTSSRCLPGRSSTRVWWWVSSLATSTST